MWDKSSLREVINKNLKDHLFVIVTNREPYIHIQTEEGVKAVRSISGVTAPLNSIMQITHGLWVAYGGSSADKLVVDKNDKVKLPPQNPKYTLKRVWLDKKEVEGYYYGFANETIWPLCHIAYVRPAFDNSDWQYYKKVNEKFAKKILDEVGDKKAFVWIQDYHFTLLPGFLKKRNPKLVVAQFWHIPWPTAQIFRICPQKKEILEGLLANELLGFHLNHYCRNFLDSVASELEAKVDYENSKVFYKGHETIVRPFPVGIDYELLSGMAKSQKIFGKKLIKKHSQANYKYLCVSVDRLEYTKGIIERIKAIDRFLEKYPKYQGKFVYLAIGAPSRVHIKAYQDLIKDIKRELERVNWKYYSNSWYPIHFLEGYMGEEEITAYYKSADLCMVNSLDDGMNLVCKEFIASCKSDAALILSQFTGAARDLTDALTVNPYDIEQTADSIKEALEMKEGEKKRRMKNLKAQVKEKNIYRWAGKFIIELSQIWDKK